MKSLTLKSPRTWLAVGLLGCATFALGESLADHEGAVTKDFEPFRTEFNAASEDVRAVLLVAPT